MPAPLVSVPSARVAAKKARKGGVIAEGKDPASTEIREAFTTEPTTLSPDASLDEAVAALRESHVRRLPVVEDSRAVGIVSIGDLAQARDERSALADISAASPNN